MFRFPDKPCRQIKFAALAALSGDYIAELKLDGWRCLVHKLPSGLTFTSRHRRPIPISDSLAECMSDRLVGLPVGTLVDGEWLGRRAGVPEGLVLFDLLQFGELPLFNQSTAERLDLLREVVPADLLPPTADGDYEGFFTDMMVRPEAEGIVLKRRAARYIGSTQESALNPGWFKCKWRGGLSGRVQLVTAGACVGSTTE